MNLFKYFGAAVVAVALCVSGVCAGQITDAVIFGDSLSDVGNVHAATGGANPSSPPYFGGRFSNGPIWVEFLASNLGLPAPTPSVLGGSDYAFGGAETGSGLSLSGTPNMSVQMASYLATHSPTDSELFVLWGGANDFFSGETDIQVPVTNLSNQITTLATAGATTFLVANLPPLGQTPAIISVNNPVVQGAFDAASVEFNLLLSAQLDRLESDLGVTIYRFDVHDLFTRAIANPAEFGLTNVTDPALDPLTGIVVANPDEYLFWDSVHPTTAVHAIMGREAALAVPEPASFALLAMGGIVLATLAGRRRHGVGFLC